MLLYVLAGGALGAGARYLLVTALAERLGTAFPWGTLSVNVIGSFVIGVVATLADEAGDIGPHARTFLVVGVLGGFTTFSSFSIETQRLWGRGDFADMAAAGANVLGNVVLCLVAVTLGVLLTRRLAS